jgi:TolB-like protein/class 3 adenylate cyclase
MSTAQATPSTRRLTAILAADVAGYSRLMGLDEEGTHHSYMAHLRELLTPKIDEHRGRIVKSTGDGLLAEFPSVLDAVRCAVELQQGMTERNAGVPEDRRLEFRIGINLGDVIFDAGDIFGDGVNIAVRLESLAEPGGICVNRVVRDQVRDRLDIAFADMGEQRVKNIARPVRAYAVRLDGKRGPPAATEPSAAPLLLPDKPSIAVLPFQNLSGDPEQEYFADGMVEEITTAIARLPWLFVLARNSSFTYKGQQVDVKQVGRELGVRYVLEGSVRKAANRLRIAAQLIEAETGRHLWADRFDGLIEEVFDLQDRVAISVAGTIEPTLQAAEVRRATDRRTSDLTAYDLYLRALPNCYAWDEERLRAALDLLEQAVAHDPNFGPALALAAICHHHFDAFSNGKGSGAHRSTAVTLARRALQAAPDDPGVICNAAFVLGAFGDDIQPAIALAERGLALNPNFCRGLSLTAWLRLWAGQPEVAIQQFEAAIRLDPRFQRATRLSGIGQAHFFAHRFDDALAMFLTALEELPRSPLIHRYLAACYAHLGRLDEARQILEKLRAIVPAVLEDATRYRNPEHRELYLSGLRLAMGETA